MAMENTKKSNADKNAEALELKTLAIQEAHQGHYLQASFHAARALKLFSESGNSKNIKELKPLILEYNKKAELSEHEFSMPLDKKTTDGLKSLIKELTKEKELSKNLERIIRSRSLIPNFETAKKNATEIVPISAQFATHIEMDANGHLLSLDDFGTGWLATHYGIQMNLCLGLLDSIFSEIIIKGQLNRSAVMEILLAKDFFSSDLLLRFDTALERHEESDYLSAIHILVPLFEKMFMDFSGLLGLNTIASARGKTVSTRGSTLSSEILNSQEYQAVWGKDFCHMLNYFLFDRHGYRFRQKVAHGEITTAECNFSSFNVIMFFALKIILMLKVVPKSKTV